METLSKHDIARIMKFIVGKINRTQKIIIDEINPNFKSATSFVNYVSKKYNISKTAVWHSFRIICRDGIIDSKPPNLSNFGQIIKEGWHGKN